MTIFQLSRYTKILILVFALVVLYLVAVDFNLLKIEAATTIQTLKGACPDCYASAARYYWRFQSIYFVSWFFVAFLLLVLLLEKLIPADQDQRVWSKGLYVDVLWMFVHVGLYAFFIVSFLHFFKEIINTHFSFLKISSIAELPVTLQALLLILFVDFLEYFSHWFRHKVDFFWRFHAVHHSQRQLNIFTDFREHPLDILFSKIIVIFIAALFFPKVNAAILLAWFYFNNFYTRFIHANIKFGMGPLRYLFITPQAHRIHHSMNVLHRDKNFGVIFSIWDQLFNTYYYAKDEYPATGIEDKNFPLEQETGGVGFGVLLKQLIYPFK